MLYLLDVTMPSPELADAAFVDSRAGRLTRAVLRRPMIRGAGRRPTLAYGIVAAFLLCVPAPAQDRSMERIPLALLLRTDRRGPGDIERAVEAAARLGLEITGQGRASISARAAPEVFERLFGTTAGTLPAEPPGARDAGRPAGYAATGPLPVPPELAGLVTEITVSTPARRL